MGIPDTGYGTFPRQTFPNTLHKISITYRGQVSQIYIEEEIYRWGGEANSIIAQQVMRPRPLEYQWLAGTRFSFAIIITYLLTLRAQNEHRI